MREKKEVKQYDETDELTQFISPSIVIDKEQVCILIAQEHLDLIEMSIRTEEPFFMITHADHDDYLELAETENDNEWEIRLYKEGVLVHAFSEYVYYEDIDGDLQMILEHFITHEDWAQAHNYVDQK